MHKHRVDKVAFDLALGDEKHADLAGVLFEVLVEGGEASLEFEKELAVGSRERVQVPGYLVVEGHGEQGGGAL